MGNAPSSSFSSKESLSGGNGRFSYSTITIQRGQEMDANVADLFLDDVEDSNAFFAIYDGHGGQKMFNFAAINVHKKLVTEEAYRNGHYEEVLKKVFLDMDKAFLADATNAKDSSGCTAIAVLITGDKIYVANVGNSRCVLSVKGEVKLLSNDQKPSGQVEKDHISNASGCIKGRLNGKLAVPRALDDFKFKENKSLIPENQIVTANPDVTVHDITKEDEFLVLASSAIWDHFSSQQAVDFVRLQISEHKELDKIGEILCGYCLSESSPDNMTVIIVAILNGRKKDEWYCWMTYRKNGIYSYTESRLESSTEELGGKADPVEG